MGAVASTIKRNFPDLSSDSATNVPCNQANSSSNNANQRIIQNDVGIWRWSGNKRYVTVTPAGGQNSHWTVYDVQVTGYEFCCIFGFQDQNEDGNTEHYYLHRRPNKKILFLKKGDPINPDTDSFDENDPRVFQDTESPLSVDGYHHYHSPGETNGPYIGVQRGKLFMTVGRAAWDLTNI